MILMIEFYL